MGKAGSSVSGACPILETKSKNFSASAASILTILSLMSPTCNIKSLEYPFKLQ